MVNPLHFTIGTGPGLHPTIQQLSLENDLLLVKASLLYADRVRLCSIGSALALEYAQLIEASDSQRQDWVERHFEALAPMYPEEAATMREFFRQYRNLCRQRPGTLNRTQVQLKFQLQAKLRRAWDSFDQGIGEFLRIAGADGIIEALETGLLDLHSFEAGGIERMGGLTPEGEDQMSDELFGALIWEYFDLSAEAVADGETNPLFDRASGEFFKAGVEAGVIEPTESGIARGRHSGLASDLLQRLPLFERATIQLDFSHSRRVANRVG